MNGRFRIRSASLRQTARKRLQGEHIENDTFHLSADRAHRLNDRRGRTARRHSGQYATAAKAASPAFSGFSAKRGETLHISKFTGGKPATPSCTTCHGDSPRSVGRTPAGKSIEPVAVSVSPARYTDPAKVEKWFRRNCTEVLGRECTPLEKGDWLTYVISQ